MREKQVYIAVSVVFHTASNAFCSCRFEPPSVHKATPAVACISTGSTPVTSEIFVAPVIELSSLWTDRERETEAGVWCGSDATHKETESG